MDALGSILFLALCTLIPTIMAGVILYRLARWVILRSGWRSTLEQSGWSADVARDAVAEALEDAGLPTGRADLSWLASREGAYVAYYRRRGAGRGTGEARRTLIVPRDTEGACGALQPRVGGLLEKAALSLAEAFSSEARDFDGWEWALVFPESAAWLEPEMSPRLRDFLHPGETLAFGRKWIVLSLREGEMPEMLGRLDDLRLALG